MESAGVGSGSILGTVTALGKYRVRIVLPALAGLLAVAAVEGPPSAGADSGSGSTAYAGQAHPASGAPAVHTKAAFPALRARVVMANLDTPWDVAVMPDGSWLVTERDRQRILMHTPRGGRRVLSRGPAGLWSSGETGLMSIVRDPRVRQSRRIYTCTGWQTPSGHHDIRVLAWRLNATHTRAHVVDTLLAGIQTTTGRHGGCRLRIDRVGALWVGTGDAAVGTNPQNLRSLNGKLLRMNRFTGRPWRTNPWIRSPNRHKRYIYNYGHRNVQGLALRPHGDMWSVEHGTDRDDEVNHAVRGGNYGWNPVPGYDESTPMTDYSLPGKQIGARWRSGYPTLATSGAVWVQGKKWGRYQGTLAVCALKASELLFMRFDGHGTFRWLRRPVALRGTYGRLRSVVQTANHDLLITTSNGGGSDKIIRVSPR